MSDGLFFLLFKGLIGFGLPIAWGIRELVLLRREPPSTGPGEPVPVPLGEPAPAAVANEDEPPHRIAA